MTSEEMETYRTFGTAAIQAGEAGVTQDEFQQYLGAAHYLFRDDDVRSLLKRYPRLEKLLIGISHMIRTSNLSKKVREEMKIRWRIAVRLELLVLNRNQSDEEEEAIPSDALIEFLQDKNALEVLEEHPKVAEALFRTMTKNKEQELGSLATFNLLVNFGYAAIDDTDAGWRGRLVTERIKTIKIEGIAPKRKKFLGIF